MKSKRIRSWQGLERALQSVEAERSQWVKKANSVFSGSVPKLLFRGHSDARWRLTTTLERYTTTVTTWEHYRTIAGAVRPTIESLTSHKWPSEIDSHSWKSDHAFGPPPPDYPYLVFLRHHGFPSPLLDWTESFYIAAFFAFSAPGKQSRAIYACLEEIGDGKHAIADKPSITSYGRYVTTHPRHVLQQAVYTACSKKRGGRRHFAQHEEAFANSEGDQDLLWKFVLPARLRLEVLRRLDAFNLNGYSLFQNDERLMETLALKEIDFAGE